MALNRPYMRLPSPPRMNQWQYQVYYRHKDNPICRGHATIRWSGLMLDPDEIIQEGEIEISQL